MKTYYTALILLTLILLNTQFLYSQWVQTNGPGWGNVVGIAVNGDTLFASCDRGVFLSTDDGISWTKLSLSGFKSIVVNGTYIFAGNSSGVFLSTNNGIDWKQVNNGLINYSVLTLAVKGNDIYAGTYGGIFITKDNGENWTSVNSGIGDTTSISSIVISGNNLFVGTNNQGVFLSSDDGKNWIQVNNGISFLGVYSLAVSGINIYALAASGFYLSTDNGSNWIKKRANNRTTDLLAVSGDNIYLGWGATVLYNGGVILSTNNGQDWNNLMNFGDICALVANGNHLYAGARANPDIEYVAGLFRSTNNGSQWDKIGIPVSNIHALLVNGSNVLAGSEKIYTSSDNGTYWSQGTSFGSSILTFAKSGSTFAVGYDEDLRHTGGISVSTNNGISWTNWWGYASNCNAIAFKDSNIFAAAYGVTSGLFLSTNYGMSWKYLHNGLPGDIMAMITKGDNLYIGIKSHGVYLSTNNGTNWTQINNSFTTVTVNALTVNNNNIFAGTAAGVFRSSDDGLTWETMNDGLSNTNVQCFTFIGDNIFAGTSDGIYFSTNYGLNWTFCGMTGLYVVSLVANETYLFAGTVSSEGVWKISLSDFALPVELTSFTAARGSNNIRLNWRTATELNNMGFDVERSANKSDWENIGFVKGNGNSTSPISYSYADKSASKATKYYYRLKQIDNNGSYKYSNIVEVDLFAPSVFSLDQNYPNPFNPNTVISYSLPSASNIKLILYNPLGQTIKLLENSFKSAGNYSLNFNASDLPSGIYFYKLEAGHFSRVKKMILIK